jgi:hypothetical protein
MALGRLLLIPAAVLALTPLPSAQTTKLAPAPKLPQLKLEIIPLKKTYFVGETVFVKYRLTSLADGTLCFPTPAAEAEQSLTGYFTTDAMPSPLDTERDRFIEGFWEKSPTDDQLRSLVANEWIKLGMSEPYNPKRVGKVPVVTTSGTWVLQTKYGPPRLGSGQRAIVESLGCAAPDQVVHSAPVTIDVIDLQK